jgi:SET domain-containing protein
MLLVKAAVKQSSIHGRGLFADQFIKRGTVIWRFNEKTGDRYFDKRHFLLMPKEQRRHLKRYCYLSRQHGRFVWSNDDSIYMNHSPEPNTDDVDMNGESEGATVANRDINIGEELLCDYRKFDKLSSGKVFYKGRVFYPSRRGR